MKSSPSSSSSSSSSVSAANSTTKEQQNLIDICDRLTVMRLQEETNYKTIDYISKVPPMEKMIDEMCREKMIQWCQQFIMCVSECQNHQKTVFIAISYLDRFLSSSSKVATKAIYDRSDYQLAIITSLYLAIKLHEPVEVSLSTFCRISKDTRTTEQFVEMEKEMINALNWNLNGPTTVCFIEHFCQLIPLSEDINVSNIVLQTLLKLAKNYAGLTLQDYHFVPIHPSTLAVCCISVAMSRIPIALFDRCDRRIFFSLLSKHGNVDLKTNVELRNGKRRLEGMVRTLPETETTSNLKQLRQQQQSSSSPPPPPPPPPGPIRNKKVTTNNDSLSLYKSMNLSHRQQRASPVCVSRSDKEKCHR